MKESYCGLCDDCQLGASDFLEALATVKGYLDTFHGRIGGLTAFPGRKAFLCLNFARVWTGFSATPNVRVVKTAKVWTAVHPSLALDGAGHCSECPELMVCEKFAGLTREYPDQKANYAAGS